MIRFLSSILNRLAERFDPEVVAASLTRVTGNVGTAAATFAIFLVAWLLLRRVLGPALRRSRLDGTTAAFVEASAKYGILGVGAVAAVGELGIHTASLVASLGIAGLTAGFAARDALSNVISGLLIYLDRPFVIDDLVEVEGQYGRVDRITLRSTRVVTADGRMLAIPNSDMVNETVASYTNFAHLRLGIPVQIGVAEDLGRVREILLALVQDDPEYMSEPAPHVVVTELGDYNVTVELQAWLDDERAHGRKRPELRERMFEALSAAGVDMPYETLSLTPVELRKTA